MNDQGEGTLGLTATLERHQDEIAAAWAEMARHGMAHHTMAHHLPDSYYAAQSLDELKATCRRILAGLIQTLTTGSYTHMESHLADIAGTLGQGVDVGEIIETFLLVKEAAFPFIVRAFSPESSQAHEAITQLDVCVRGVISLYGRLHGQVVQRRLQEQQQRTALMLNAAQTASSSLELDQILKQLVEGMKAAVGVRDCSITLLDTEGKLISRSGTGDLRERFMALRNRPLNPADYGFFQQVVTSRKPVVCYDAQTDARANREMAQALGIKSVLGIPMQVNGRLLGVTLLITFEEHHAFTGEEIELVSGIAHALALAMENARIAIENARLYQQAEQVAVMEERQRMARELHDSVSQTLYSITNYAEAASGSLNVGDARVTSEYLHELQEAAQDALREMRLLIFELRPSVLEREGLVAALRARLEAVEARAGFQIELQVTGEKRLPGAMEEELLRIVQEALNNAVKHARAKHVQVVLQFDEDTVYLDVCDDGVGFDPTTARTGGGLGLMGMEERLARMGGKLQVKSAPGKGTQVRVKVDTRIALSQEPWPASLPGMAGQVTRSFAQTLDANRLDAPIRVLVADDHEIVRKGICAALRVSAQADVCVVGEASDGQEAVARAEGLRPDVILMDLAMPGMDGVEATRQIAARHPEARILVLTSLAADQNVFAAIKAGASGYLLKESGPDNLLRAIRQVYHGEASLDPRIARTVLREFVRLSERQPAPDLLSEREAEVLRRLAEGRTDKEIAAQLSIAETTVRSHVHHLLGKLQLANRTQAIQYALREELALSKPERKTSPPEG